MQPLLFLAIIFCALIRGRGPPNAPMGWLTRDLNHVCICKPLKRSGTVTHWVVSSHFIWPVVGLRRCLHHCFHHGQSCKYVCTDKCWPDNGSLSGEDHFYHDIFKSDSVYIESHHLSDVVCCVCFFSHTVLWPLAELHHEEPEDPKHEHRHGDGENVCFCFHIHFYGPLDRYSISSPYSGS